MISRYKVGDTIRYKLWNNTILGNVYSTEESIILDVIVAEHVFIYKTELRGKELYIHEHDIIKE